jgi:prepilin-type N-terminal cleavage/methylation domain-containing protein
MDRKIIKPGFTLTELLVAVGLLTAVLAASTVIFHYSIESQRTAMATAEIMRTLRTVADQLNTNLAGLRKDGWLIVYSYSDANKHSDALYFFSDGDFQSAADADVRSNTARIYFGGADKDANNLLLDMRLLVPSKAMDANDWSKASFTQCQQSIRTKFEDPNSVVNHTGSAKPKFDANLPDNLLAQRVSDLRIEWTYDSNEWTYDSNEWSGTGRRKIEWYGMAKARRTVKANSFEETLAAGTSSTYRAVWSPTNPKDWPDALRFEFTLRDSKGIIKNGKRFEHIVYIGN